MTLDGNGFIEFSQIATDQQTPGMVAATTWDAASIAAAVKRASPEWCGQLAIERLREKLAPQAG